MNSKIFVIIFFIFLAFTFKVSSKEDVFISYKVNDQIITNIDIKKEAQYLISLNNQLTNLGENEILRISKESALREKIKKIELIKYFNLGGEDQNITAYIERIYLQLKLNDRMELEEYLNKYGITVDYVEKKNSN